MRMLFVKVFSVTNTSDDNSTSEEKMSSFVVVSFSKCESGIISVIQGC